MIDDGTRSFFTYSAEQGSPNFSYEEGMSLTDGQAQVIATLKVAEEIQKVGSVLRNIEFLIARK